ncbi:hypothetical protein UFOVP266_48 [uncultured Caudovirales phage]|uniref:Uncharacterized protein n=1 Tax=uncultured Caudovirales phage TaxID=2100421 RepID=A0A6J5LMV5_9CAUD|nr:hypothetical protein UFOVP266_48 [uncultured Caudovirales phage]
MVDYNIYVPQPYDASGDIGNALRFRAAQQAEAENQLKLQAWKEDRAYQLKQREAAAANAASERAKAAELRDIYGNYGVTPAVTGARGMSYSGTGVANNPDETLFNNLVRGGYVSAAKNVAEARGEFSKTEVEKLNLDAKKYDDALARTKQYLPMIQNADDVARYVRMKYEDPVLGPIAAKMRPVEDAVRVTVDQFTKDPQGTLSSLAGLTGADIAKQKFEKDKQDAELAKLKAETAKFTAEAKGKGAPSAFGDTNEGRQLEIINEVARGLRSPNDPEYAIAYHAQYGGKNVAAYNPETKQMELVQAPATPPANLPPPAYGATNALPAVNGVRPAGAPSNAFVTPPAAPALTGAGRPVITKAPTGGLTEAQKLKFKDEAAKDYTAVTDALRNVQDVDRVIESLNKTKLGGVTGYLSMLPSLSKESLDAESDFESLKGKMTALAKTLSAQTGKLGNLAVQEYPMLQAQISNFDPYKGEATTKYQLGQISETIKRIENSVRDAYSKQYGGEDNPFEQFRELPKEIGVINKNPHPAEILDILKQYK